MDEYQSLSHTKWECEYHVVFIPKCRRKTLYVQLRQHLGEVFRRLATQKESRIEEGHLMSDRGAHDDLHTAKVFGIAGGGIHQREERHSSGAGVRRTEEELCRTAFLGARILRVHCWARRESDSGVHQEPRAGR